MFHASAFTSRFFAHSAWRIPISDCSTSISFLGGLEKTNIVKIDAINEVNNRYIFVEDFSLAKQFPRTYAALDTVTTNFQNCILMACKRITNDWELIGQMLSNAGAVGKAKEEKPTLRLTHIQTTGSDFHKGGQQTLILTFLKQVGDISPEKIKLVYKPGNVELDSRIIGKSGDTTSLMGILNAAIYAKFFL